MDNGRIVKVIAIPVVSMFAFFLMLNLTVQAQSKGAYFDNAPDEDSISANGFLSYTIAMTLPEPAPNIEGLTYDGANIWVANPEDDLLHKVDFSSGAILATFPAPGGDTALWGGPDGLAWDGANLWVMADSNDEPHQIYKVDPTNGNVITSFPSPGPESDGLTFDGTSLYLSDSQNNRIYILDPSDGSAIDSFVVAGGRLEDLAWDGDYLWYADNLDLRIYKFDVDRREVVGYLDFPTRGGLVWIEDHLWTTQEEYMVGLQIHEPLRSYLPVIAK